MFEVIGPYYYPPLYTYGMLHVDTINMIGIYQVSYTHRQNLRWQIE